MTRKEKIQYLTTNGASAQDEKFMVWHTRDITLVIWARENGMHVQGMVGVAGYSAFIWIDQDWSDNESFVLPEMTTPKEVLRDRFFQIAAQYDHTMAAFDIFRHDIGKLANDLRRERTSKVYVLALVEAAHALHVIDEYWFKRFTEVVPNI